MSDMKRLEQLNNLNQHLKNQKSDIQNRLAHFKLQIMKKTESINKMYYYESEYIKKSGEPQILANPALYQNCLDFIKKINKAINTEKIALETLEAEKINLITQIEQTEMKIKSFETLILSVQRKIDQQLDNAETLLLNDLSIQAKIRETHE